MAPTYTHLDPQTSSESASVTTGARPVATMTAAGFATSSAPNARVSRSGRRHMQFVTSHGSPTTSDGSGSDLENQNREERKEEERSVEEIAREVARGGHRPTVGGARASTATSTTMSGGRGGGSGWSTPPNSSFKDIEDTGKWGNVTKKEKIIVFTCFIMILVAIAVGVGVFVAGRYKGGTSSSSPSSGQGDGDANATSPLPPPPETFATIEDKYSALLRLLGENPLTANYSTAVLSAYLRDLDSLGPSVVDDPIVRATKWAMETDADNLAVDQLRYRLALASVYYANNGDGWNNHQGWLSPDHVCEWGSSGGGGSRSVNEQVKCTLDMETGHRIVNELDLSSNNLTGSIPVTVSLLTTLKGMWLRDNALTGAIPGAVFGSLPKLVILYLQHNKFEGEIPVSLLDSGSLGTLFVNGNNLTGSWPAEFCPSEADPDGPFSEFGLNCDQTPCPEDCCLPENNCFV